ncbi:YciI family protein [Rhodobacter sp. HX-7-19]|uniref:YciI family protein n=1 Tax=Paragemmobacter kunshanensis TaxID=2583234 RepID=A0A6M1TRH0_9RHOB|nr:YciI family protein [Rhodobacter kunshanensis]NGQ89666.1 YciI family protein [Rhodobacter kunshanensis]
MRVALICIDKPGHLHVRQENRAAHLAHIEASGLVEMAGPFLNAAGEMCGSLVVLSVDRMEQAQDWAANDPYAKAGLFQSVDLREWKKVIG